MAMLLPKQHEKIWKLTDLVSFQAVILSDTGIVYGFHLILGLSMLYSCGIFQIITEANSTECRNVV